MEHMTAASQEARSEKAADQSRAVLLALATGAITAAYSLRQQTGLPLWFIATLCFVAAMACILRSWFLVKYRALKRRDALLESKPLPVFSRWRGSQRWDSITAWLLVIGALLLAMGLA